MHGCWTRNHINCSALPASHQESAIVKRAGSRMDKFWLPAGLQGSDWQLIVSGCCSKCVRF